ncbi:MAG: EFR1 family ferrodoxin [Treponema sp.]|jgi:ferredoxin|nr:EFR1 family ferrodoxin [Treponema sp.]
MTNIYYFSGTGNTYWSAKKLAARIGSARIFPISREMKQPEIRIRAEAVIFMFPAYAYGTPVMVRRFLEKADVHADYLAALVSYGTSPGGALAEVHAVLARKKLILNYAGRIPAVENFIPIFGAPGEALRTKRLALQSAATEQAAEAILTRANSSMQTFQPLFKIISSLYRLARPAMINFFRLTEACNACGLCAGICPAGAIKMADKGPVFHTACETCQACLNFCPRKAITFGRLGPDTRRYHHPEVTAGELF